MLRSAASEGLRPLLDWARSPMVLGESFQHSVYDVIGNAADTFERFIRVQASIPGDWRDRTRGIEVLDYTVLGPGPGPGPGSGSGPGP